MITGQRSTLSVPGHLEKMHRKAFESSVDVIMLDMEDSVPLELKRTAREQVISTLKGSPNWKRGISVRVNSTDTPYCFRDVIEVVQAAGKKIDSIVLPKVDSAGDVHFLSRLLDGVEAETGLQSPIAIDASIESALGVENIAEIASAPRVRALIFGIADYSASIGARLSSISGHGENELEIYPGHRWNFVMSRIAQTAKAHGLLAIDSPYGNFQDLQGLAKGAKMASALGFDGKWAIHPGQIETINEIFSPTCEEIDRANRILDAAKAAPERGAVAVDGRMIDKATVRLAQKLVDSIKPRN
ncbi:MAG: CoA ester lyase [Candidatus Fibromonas sp.]|jgi:citrate lyase beta subunit|nr:CoA ester lyase [Candidatus Fibromonas sp.]